jgi:hypothetical protein
LALNDCVAPARTLALPGKTVSVTPDPDGGVLTLEDPLVVPVQPSSTATATSETASHASGNAEFFGFSIKSGIAIAAMVRRNPYTTL